jgi:AcrR family transcriptional regulator
MSSPESIPNSATALTTPARILEVATQLFAEHGFEKTTVRQISEGAGVNLAAINYHFSDKEALYIQVLSRAHQCSETRHPLETWDPEQDPKLALRRFVEAFVRRMFDPQHDQVFGRLMAQEMMQPTRALDRLVETEMRPTMKALSAMVAVLLGYWADEAELRRHCFSIIGQIVFYKHAAPLVARLNPGYAYDEAEISALVEHITNFSLAALAGYPRRE